MMSSIAFELSSRETFSFRVTLNIWLPTVVCERYASISIAVPIISYLSAETVTGTATPTGPHGEP